MIRVSVTLPRRTRLNVMDRVRVRVRVRVGVRVRVSIEVSCTHGTHDLNPNEVSCTHGTRRQSV